MSWLYVIHAPVSMSTAPDKRILVSSKLDTQLLFVPNSASRLHIMTTIIGVLANGGDR